MVSTNADSSQTHLWILDLPNLIKQLWQATVIYCTSAAVIAKEQIACNVWSSALLGKFLGKHIYRGLLWSSVSHLPEPHTVQLRGKCRGWLIFSFAEETSICSWMGLAGSRTALSLTLDDKGVEKSGSGSGSWLKQQRSQRNRKPGPPPAHSLPWWPPAFRSPSNRLWPSCDHVPVTLLKDVQEALVTSSELAYSFREQHFCLL